MSNLKEYRLKSNLTQLELSERSGVSHRMIQYYEQGVKDINKAQGLTLQALAQVLGCTMEDLLELNKYKKEVEE